MGPSYATVIVPIAAGQADALRALLATHIDPQPGPNDSLLCQPLFPFDAVGTLHFMSFLILAADPEEGIPAQLVLDATFDDDRGSFFEVLIGAARAGLDSIYAHCIGYPANGTVSDIARFFADHDVGADAYFSGFYGRRVAQIRQEHALREALKSEVDRLRTGPLPPPATPEGRLAALRAFVRATPDLHWAKRRWPTPFLMQRRITVAVGFGIAIACALAALDSLLLAAFGIGPGEIYMAVMGAPGWAAALGTPMPAAAGLGILAMLSLGLHWTRLAGEAAANSARPSPPLLDALAFLAHPLFWGAIAGYSLLLGLVGIALLAPETAVLPPLAKEELARLRDALLGSATCWEALRLALAALAGLAACAYADTSLALAIARMPPSRVLARKLGRLLIHLLEAPLLVLLAVAVLAPFAPRGLADGASVILAAAGVALIALLAGAAIVYLLIALFLLVVALHERKDLRTYLAADALMQDATGNRAARAREEGGINALQNHLASLTYIKPGRFRLFALRLSLALIGLLARIWYNQGHLGGIATILSARWVLIDNGRRLVFLDNYGGGWESYLNEFIDMSAVTGLNAIWTNTFIKWPRPAGTATPVPRYAFPATRFYTSRGARDERPFKTYVRYSQIETLAWYGAYHRRSIGSINGNTRIRQDLFQPLAAHEIDRLVGKL